MEDRTPPGAAKARQAALTAWFDLCDEARCTPDVPWMTAAEVAARIRKRGGYCTDKKAEKILYAYRVAPLVCPVATWHDFGRPCREGNHHPGCCPGTCPYPPITTKEEA